jgi:hypothetical protein
MGSIVLPTIALAPYTDRKIHIRRIWCLDPRLFRRQLNLILTRGSCLLDTSRMFLPRPGLLAVSMGIPQLPFASLLVVIIVLRRASTLMVSFILTYAVQIIMLIPQL